MLVLRSSPPHRPRLGLAAAALLAQVAAGCSPDSGRATAGDTLDVEVLPRLVLHEELRIGSLDDPDHGFSAVGVVDVDADGRVYVFESMDAHIRVYAPDGRLLARMGGAGAGPGEFRGAMVDIGVMGDTVWAVDLTAGRLLLFERDGRLLSSALVQEVVMGTEITGLPVRVFPALAGPDGLLVGLPHPASGISAPANPSGLLAASGGSVEVPHVRFRGDGTVADTAGWYTLPVHLPDQEIINVGASRYALPLPPSADPFILPLADGRLQVERPVAPSHTDGVFRVSRFDLAGDTVYRRSFRYRPVGYPADALDAAARSATVFRSAYSGGRRFNLERDPADSARARATIRERIAFPEFQPPVQSYHLARDGALWLRREDTGGEAFRWIVLDAEGMPVGELELPRAGLRIAWSRADTVWCVAADELGVPWLVRYRLAPVP